MNLITLIALFVYPTHAADTVDGPDYSALNALYQDVLRDDETCKADLAASNSALADCLAEKAKLETVARVKRAKSQAAAVTNAVVEPRPVDLGPEEELAPVPLSRLEGVNSSVLENDDGDEDNDVDVNVRTGVNVNVPPTEAPDNFEINTSPPEDDELEDIEGYPLEEPEDVEEPEPVATTPAPVSGHARAEFLIGITGGLSYAGNKPILAADRKTVVGGGLEVPLSATAGFLLTEKSGLVLGGLLHTGVEPLRQGSNAGFDFLLGCNLNWSKVMIGFGPSFTAYQSWNGQMGASLEGGEVKLIGLVPFGHPRFGADLFLAAGAKGGALMTSDTAQLGWGIHPSAELGLTLHFGTAKLTEE